MSLDDAALLAGFRQATLTPDQFDHRAHVRLAWLLLQDQSFEDALAELREGLPRVLQAFGLEDLPDQGYHETTTQAFLHLVASTAAHHAGGEAATDSLAFVEAQPQLLSSKLLRLYYSPGRRKAAAAKKRFLEPDLAPLPMRPEQGEPLPIGRQPFEPEWIRAEQWSSRIFILVLGLLSAVLLGFGIWADWFGELQTGIYVGIWLVVVPALAWLGQRWPVWEYPHCGWRISTESLDLWKGLWMRWEIRVPRSRVQYTDVKQGPIQRRFGLGTLQVHVAGTEDSTVSVPGLPHELALRLRDELLKEGGDDAV